MRLHALSFLCETDSRSNGERVLVDDRDNFVRIVCRSCADTMHCRTSSASIRNSVSTRSGTVASAAGTLRRSGKNERVAAAAIESLVFPSERAMEGHLAECDFRNVSTHSTEVLEPTETDVTESTGTGAEERIIREDVLPYGSLPQTLLPIEDLVDLLHELNSADGELRKVSGAFCDRAGNMLSLDELAQILRHINLFKEELNVSLPSNGSDRRGNHRILPSFCLDSVLFTRTESTDTTAIVSKDTKATSLLSIHHSPVLPLSELIRRLVLANGEFDGTKRNLMLQRDSKTTMSVDEMTRILRHINSCSRAASLKEPSWHGAYGSGETENRERQIRSVCGTPKERSELRLRRRSCRSLRSHESNVHGISSWTVDECVTSSAEIALLTGNALLTGDDHSLDLEGLHVDDTGSGSGFSLRASIHSCESSVTWYEGSDFEEIS